MSWWHRWRRGNKFKHILAVLISLHRIIKKDGKTGLTFRCSDLVLHQRRSKERIQCDLQHVIEHARNQVLQQLVRLFQARVSVRFDQLCREGATGGWSVTIGVDDGHDHEVVANQLKRVLTELQSAADGLVRVKDLLAHLPVQGRLDLLSALTSPELLLLG